MPRAFLFATLLATLDESVERAKALCVRIPCVVTWNRGFSHGCIKSGAEAPPPS